MEYKSIRYAAISLLLLAGCSTNKHKVMESLRYKAVTVANGGSIEGTVRFDGTLPQATAVIVEKDQDACGTSHPNPAYPGAGGISGAIVYLDKIAEGKPFDTTSQDAKLDQKGCEFLPHVQLLLPDQKLLVSNSDKVLHNLHLFLDQRSISNDPQPEGAPPQEVEIGETGLHRIGCDVHPWMHAYVQVPEHPYYVITDAAGHFSMKDVPPGQYTLKVWRDSWVLNQPKGPNGKVSGYDWGDDFRNQQPIEVRPGAATTADFLIH